ncbi:hypothetical protein OSB04_017710 [Centaurea solstitialis]|uniref:No apical meristem-associated C-terminal domain-containing protein n=1 Tax=Centaurea solstitialis TaxID=347529 RepID=A0AA38T3D7_9ASTR|nr:hypothetical protein OSB04_017710 [Centaurea solstitialis]
MDPHGTPSGSRRPNSASQTPPPSGVYRPAMTNPMGFGSWLPPSGWPQTPMVDTNWAYANMIANTPMMTYTMHPQQPTTQTQQPTPSQVWEPRDGTNLSPQSWGDDEEVPETQPESPPPPPPPQPKGKKRGKGKNVEASSSANPTKTKAPPKPWSSEEEVELAKSWAEISEDSTIDNFWMAVKRSLDIRMGYGPNVRSSDSVQTKVRLLLSGVSKFACIYNNTLNHRNSGESDVNILERALERYRREYNRTFPHQAAWRVLIECPKYNPVEMMNPSDIRAPTNKRSKTSETQTDSPGDSDARTYTHLEDDEHRSQTERPRPMGRNAARRAGSSSSTNDTNTGMSTQVGALTHGITGLMDILKEKQRMTHFQFYTSPHNHLSGPILETTLREKARLRIEYDWPPFE